METEIIADLPPSSRKFTDCFGNCGKMVPYRTTAKVYCEDCRDERRLEQSRISAEKQRRKKGITQVKGIARACEECGVDFYSSSTRGDKYCRDCAGLVAKRRAAEYSLSKSLTRFKGETFSCVDCSVEFVADRARKRCASCTDKNKRKPHCGKTICADCSKEFASESRKRKLCDECKKARQKANSLRSWYKRSGKEKHLGKGDECPCADCGKIITKTGALHILCDECAKQRSRNAATAKRRVLGVKPRTKPIKCKRSCALCSSELPPRAKLYCVACASERAKAKDRETKARKAREVGAKKVGSMQKCQHCGDDFVLRVGTLKHCDECLKLYHSRWSKDKRQTDIKFCLNDRIRRGINSSFGAGKKAFRSWESLVGFDVDDLKTHLERQFTRGMTWENRDKWHIDHIRPLASFDYTSPEDDDFKDAWSLTNLRPLWAEENLSKSDKTLYLI